MNMKGAVPTTIKHFDGQREFSAKRIINFPFVARNDKDGNTASDSHDSSAFDHINKCIVFSGRPKMFGCCDCGSYVLSLDFKL
jgi:hypothetical protein